MHVTINKTCCMKGYTTGCDCVCVPQQLLLVIAMTRRRRHLSEIQKIYIVALHDLKALTETQIARRLKISRKAAHRWIERVQRECSIKERHHTGRKPVLNTSAQRKAYKLLLKTGHDSATHISALLQAARITKAKVSRTTIIKAARSYAKKAGLPMPVSVHARPKKRLSKEHKDARLEFAKANINHDWSRTLFTDRVKFVLDKPGVKYHKKIWKPAGSQWSVFTTNKPGICCNVYGGINIHGTTSLITVTGTTGYKGKKNYKTKQGHAAKSITQSEYKDVLWMLLKQGTKLFKGKPWQLMQDGDKAHRVAEVVIRKWNRKMPCKVHLLKHWPANSPDFNIIENVWAHVGSKVQAKGCKTSKKFAAALNTEFSNLPSNMIHNLFASIPRRLHECIANNGDRTKH